MPSLTARLARLALRAIPIHHGKGTIVHRTPLRRLKFAEQVLDVETEDGTMRVMPNDLNGRHIYLTRTFARSVVEVLVALARSGAPRGKAGPLVLWDIGANIGYVSRAFLRRVPDSRVVAVEPLPDVHSLLRHNLPADRAVCVQAAVSHRAGAGGMVRVPGHSGASHLGDGGTPVQLVTGEELAAHGIPDLVKIDVEGHEPEVFRGIEPQLAGVRAVVFECHRWPHPDIEATLARNGFTVVNVVRRWNGWRLAAPDATPRGYRRSPDFVAVRPAELGFLRSVTA